MSTARVNAFAFRRVQLPHRGLTRAHTLSQVAACRHEIGTDAALSAMEKCTGHMGSPLCILPRRCAEPGGRPNHSRRALFASFSRRRVEAYREGIKSMIAGIDPMGCRRCRILLAERERSQERSLPVCEHPPRVDRESAKISRRTSPISRWADEELGEFHAFRSAWVVANVPPPRRRPSLSRDVPALRRIGAHSIRRSRSHHVRSELRTCRHHQTRNGISRPIVPLARGDEDTRHRTSPARL